MKSDRKKSRGRFWKGLGRFLDISRRVVLNLIFWSVLILIVIALIPPRIPVKENSLLYLKPDGILVDSLNIPDYPFDTAPFLNRSVETSAIDMGNVIRKASADDRISGMILDLSTFEYGSLAVLQDLETDLLSFKEKGKKIYAWAPDYNQYAYYLASTADRIFMDTMGRVLLSGFGVFRTYFKEGMDKWDLGMAVFQAGEYKSFVEPYLYDRMSEGVKKENLRWTGNLWNQVLDSISLNRGVEKTFLKQWVDNYPAYLSQADHNEAESALKAGLVDDTGSWRDFSSEMVKITGYDADHEGFRSIHWLDYQVLMKRKLPEPFEKTVAVITANGDIHSGEGTQWTIGSDTLIRRLEEAENERSVRAIVLRLDTGGGSAFASEEIRRTLERIRERGMTVVVSMGGVSASGGYWIASECDELWSSPGTITGSIGVFSLIPETDRFLEEHLGIRGDGVGTTWMSGQGRPDQPLNGSSRAVLQSGVNSTYKIFLSLVSENREISPEDLRPLAEGRIWTGEEAVRYGLCDKNGSLREAVRAAADLAYLEDFNTWYVPPVSPSVMEMAASFVSRIYSDLTGEVFAPIQSLEVYDAFTDLVPGKIYALSPIRNGNIIK